ncbi:PP2C family protein-serine/threonine phosphatase [Streptomyces sp. NPDC021212]|uniref:PP2C family protein-serine/threonine phosphatase n=1 Tax=Streptomyces sp. NPDC021212 TaxID=3365118 RepID=UPI0037A75818
MQAPHSLPNRIVPDRHDTADAHVAGEAARLAFLRRAISDIGTTLNLGHAARLLAASAVPGFADFASVHLHDHVTASEDGSIARNPHAASVMHRVAAVHHGDPRHGEELQAGQTFAYPSGTAMARFLALIEPVLITRVDGDVLRKLPAELDSPSARLVLTDSSVMLVPLSVRDSVLGFLVFGRKPGRPAFVPADLAACLEMAERAALSLHNARLYHHQATTSSVLRRSLLPMLPPHLPGVEIAYRYHPYSRTTQVGGDWLDAIRLPGHRVGLVIGDVAGHGLHAAVAMGQLRTAVKTLATLDLPPAQLLLRLDQFAQGLDQTILATCLYGVYDPLARRATFASAGHLPPILVSPDGEDELLEVPVSAPIGVGSTALDTIELSIDPGSLLLMCTDGLVETREEDIEDGLSAVRRSLTVPHLSLEEACDALLRRQHPGGHHDDATVLMARLHGIPHDRITTWLRPQRPEQVRVVGWSQE